MKAEWTNSDSLTTTQTTKVVLVFDKPESCTSCMHGIFNKKWFCLATNKDIDICDRYNIPTWCPLKPIPQKKEETFAYWIARGCNDPESYINGWNDCLDELLGETE